MSKMFDSLRRAEAERKKRLAATEMPDDVKPTIAPPPVDNWGSVSAQQTDGFPDDFLRELGILYNSLEAALGNGGKRVIVFVSSASGEGTTTLVSSYARLVGLKNPKRVLLVELNARRPSLFWKFGLNSKLGMTNYFSEKRTLDEVVQHAPQGDFDVIHAGENDPVKIQLNLEATMPRFLEEAKKRYDTILIDAPPVIGSPETPPLASFVDGVVLVVQSGRTKREIIQRSLNIIGQFKGRTLGVVLNRKKYYIPDFIYRRI